MFKDKLLKKIKELSESYFREILEIRHYLHIHPELSFKEYSTVEFIRQNLETRGIEYKRSGDTGLIATIYGKNQKGKTIALRADMDALPITEQNELLFKSQNPGVMHACGHDIHMASLLGTAFILNDIKDTFSGTVRLIFQPGEEVLPGGAQAMIENGALKSPDVDAVIAQHVLPEMMTGNTGFKKGVYMASADEIYIRVKGRGGHAAMPWKLIDPVLISAHLIVALQQIAGRNVITTIPSVLSFGRIQASGSTNVIPDEVTIAGTFRTFDEKWREEVHKKIIHISEELTNSMGGSVEVEIRKGYPVLINDDGLTGRCRKYATEYLGDENVSDMELRMTSDDFAYYAAEKPACYYRLGIGSSESINTSLLHNSNFMADENSLLTGMGLMTYICVNELNN